MFESLSPLPFDEGNIYPYKRERCVHMLAIVNVKVSRCEYIISIAVDLKRAMKCISSTSSVVSGQLYPFV